MLENAGSRADLWLGENPERVPDFLAQVFGAITELQSREMVHFDAHWANIITDGARYRLVDFGLAMSANMESSETERTFLSGHLHYDYGVVLGYLGLMLAVTLGEEPSSRMLGHHLDRLGALEGKCPPALLGALDRFATRFSTWSTSSSESANRTNSALTTMMFSPTCSLNVEWMSNGASPQPDESLFATLPRR